MDATVAVMKKKLLWIIGGTKELNWSDANYPLWLTYLIGGGFHYVEQSLSTSEIFNSETKEITSGPTMPVKISHHCVVELGPDKFLLIGGYQKEILSNDTWKIHMDGHVPFSKGPSMIKARAKHSCAKMNINGSIYIVAVGGYHTKTVELLNISQMQNWIRGNIHLKCDIRMSYAVFTCSILASIVTILVCIVVILTSIDQILEKCFHREYYHNTCKF